MLADLDLAQKLVRHVELLDGLTVVVGRDQRVECHVHAVPYMGNLSYDELFLLTLDIILLLSVV